MNAAELDQNTHHSKTINFTPCHWCAMDGDHVYAHPPAGVNNWAAKPVTSVPQHRDTRGILGSASCQDAEDKAVNTPLQLPRFWWWSFPIHSRKVEVQLQFSRAGTEWMFSYVWLLQQFHNKSFEPQCSTSTHLWMLLVKRTSCHFFYIWL